MRRPGGRETGDKAYARRVSLSAKDAQVVVEEFRENVEASYLHERDIRREMETDLAFVAGDQWPTAVKQARGTKRPMITVNQLPQFVNQVTNPLRDADIAIKVVPVDDNTDPQLANIYNQIITQIQYRSDAKQIYVTGNEHQAKCGRGWWRVGVCYPDDDSFNQEIKLTRIENPLSVYPDPAAKLPTKEDGMHLAVIENWSRKAFKRKWPKAKTEEGVEVPSSGSPTGFMWGNEEVIAVGEYYKKIPKQRLLAMLENGEVHDITDLDDASIDALMAGSPIMGEREVTKHQVMKYMVSGHEVLEPPVKWLGRYIPIVCATGAETPLKNGTMIYGVVRFARDPQQMYNFYRTATAEVIGWTPKAPWLLTQKMIQGHQAVWDTIAQSNRVYLPYNIDPMAPGMKPERQDPPQIPTGLVNEASTAADDMKRVTGIYDASLGAKSNETSGRAINAREQQGDTANNHFQDNLVHALNYTGRILIDLIPKIYDNQRIIRLTNPDGTERPVPINRVLYEVDGEPVLENDLSQGQFDVRVTVGRNFISKQAEAVSAFMEMAKSIPNPQAQLLLAYLVVKNSDFPHKEELERGLKNMIPPGLLADPNDPSAPKPPNPMDDPEFVAKLEDMSAKTAEVQQRTAKSNAETKKILAETDLLDGQIDMQYAGVPLDGGAGGGAGAPQQAFKLPKGVEAGGQLSLPPPMEPEMESLQP